MAINAKGIFFFSFLGFLRPWLAMGESTSNHGNRAQNMHYSQPCESHATHSSIFSPYFGLTISVTSNKS